MDEDGVLRCIQYIDKHENTIHTQFGAGVGIHDNWYDKNGQRVSFETVMEFGHYNGQESIFKKFELKKEYWIGDYYKIGNKKYNIISVRACFTDRWKVLKNIENGEDAFDEKFIVTVDVDMLKL